MIFISPSGPKVAKETSAKVQNIQLKQGHASLDHMTDLGCIYYLDSLDWK